MKKHIGFIGGGNMASAMIHGILEAKLVTPEDILASAHTTKTTEALRKRFGIQTTLDNKEVAAQAQILILAVKPVVLGEVLSQIKDVLKKDTLVISIAAGWTLSMLKEALGDNVHLIRSMPNTPAMVGEAMSAVCLGELVTKEECEEATKIFNSFGKCEIVSEKLMDAVVSVSGSSPAYVYLFIEAMADAAVEDGMPRTQAYQFAAQSVLGAAKMVLETGKHPGELKDAVCSPAGTTIEAVAVLEQEGFRGTVMKAQHACAQKSRDMSRK